jgi:hypothetical protein
MLQSGSQTWWRLPGTPGARYRIARRLDRHALFKQVCCCAQRIS